MLPRFARLKPLYRHWISNHIALVNRFDQIKKAINLSMSCARRASLYLVRKKGKTISLFLTLFVVATFLFCAFGVLQTSERLGRDMRSSLGGAIYVRPSIQATTMNDGSVEIEEARFSVNQDAIEDVLSLGGFASCNPINYGFAKSDALEFIPGYGHSPQSNMGKVVALRSSALAPGFVDEGQAIIDGRHISYDDTRKVLISEELAKANGLAVGDEISLKPARLEERDGVFVDGANNDGRAKTVQIAGIFQSRGESAPEAPTPSRAENKLYSTLDVLDELGVSAPGVYTGEVDFYVKDPATLAALAHEMEGIASIDWSTSFARTNDFQYAKVAEQLAEVSGLTRMLIAAIAVSGILVLILMLIMRSRARMREMGVLLATGVPKGNIAAQMFCEVLPIAVLAVFAAWVVSIAVADLLGGILFSDIPAPLLSDQMLATGAADALPSGEDFFLDAKTALALGVLEVAAAAMATVAAAGVILRIRPRVILTTLS